MVVGGRWTRALGSLGPSLVLLAACALDRTPELSEASRTRAASTVSVPDRTPIDTSKPASSSSTTVFGSMPTPVTPAMPMQTGGLQCGGVFCPFARTPIVPCCTSDDDVSAGTARATDKCGLDFSKSAATQYGSFCWQRDQPGVADDSCAGATAQSAASEPGCCTDQGNCGSMNTSEMLGCHYQADKPPQPCGRMDVNDMVTCDPLGVFGVKSIVDVSWGGRSGGLVGLTDDGRAPITIHLMVSIESIDDGTHEVHGKVKPCGVDLPQFYSTTLCESYKPQFPITIWESKKLPTIDLSGRYQCLNPGCILTMDAKTALLGIDLMNPEAPWPSPTDTPTLKCAAGMGAACFPDHDTDMLPGVTITLRTMGMAPMGTGCQGQGYAYQAAPLSSSPAAIFGGVRRADRVLLGTRTKLGGSGKISADCNAGAGSGVAEFVQSRAWGCFVEQGTANFPDPAAGPNEACQAAEAQFLDENLPIYNILEVGKKPDSMLKVVDTSTSKGPLFSMVRLGKAGAAVSCADVRNAVYP